MAPRPVVRIVRGDQQLKKEIGRAAPPHPAPPKRHATKDDRRAHGQPASDKHEHTNAGHRVGIPLPGGRRYAFNG